MFNRFGKYSFTIKIVFVGLLITSPWLIVQIGIVVLAPDVEISSMPTCEQDSRNCAHLGGGDDYRLNEVYPTSIDKASEELYEDLIQYIDTNDWELIYENNGEDTYYVHFVEITDFWQFPDDVVVSIQGTDSGSLLEIHSESRLGWGDLGLNPDRINTIYDSIVQ
ncbi:MAG: DUF1499 domain-containing protein [Candidatus Poseidoniaceae archaeon]|nr:DUF1499 domain-containing protein [Candidatus Poseidoniaceae archaeon]